MNARRVCSVTLIVTGLCFIFGADILVDSPPDLSAFGQVERRIPGGAILGLGLVLLRLRPFRPWLSFFAAGLCWLSVGALTGRLIGLAFVLGQSSRQWFWVVVEMVVIGVTGLYLRRTDASKP